MTEAKHIFDAAMNRDKSNTDKVIEILTSFEPDSIVVYYDVDADRNPYTRQVLFRLAMLATLAACIARWHARRRS